MQQQPAHIVIADTDDDHLTFVSSALKSSIECTVTTITSTQKLHKHIHENNVDLAIVSSYFDGITCTSAMQSIVLSSPSTTVIPLVDKDDSGQIKEIFDLELTDYITRPYNSDEISLIVKKVLTIHQLKNKKQTVSQEQRNFHGIIGSCAKMEKLFDLISKIADDEVTTVLIRGESGTGKELVAKAIHNHSARKKKKFVPVNCAAIPDDLLESELFGHTKGAFTGATQAKLGRIQYADGGTLFLDEIGDMKSSLQAKLLRVLQEKEFEPVGGLQPVPVDTRIVAATHCDLEQLVRDGKFREDLYYRLSVIPLHIPPLRERLADISYLLDEFIQRYTTERNREPFSFTERAKKCLFNHDWRGNVRELENLAQHMSILYSGKVIDLIDLPEKFTMHMNSADLKPVEFDDAEMLPDERFALHQSAESENNMQMESIWINGEIDFKELINDFETRLIIHAMQKTGGNKKEAAKILNLKRTTLLEKIKKKNLADKWNK